MADVIALTASALPFEATVTRRPISPLAPEKWQYQHWTGAVELDVLGKIRAQTGQKIIRRPLADNDKVAVTGLQTDAQSRLFVYQTALKGIDAGLARRRSKQIEGTIGLRTQFVNRKHDGWHTGCAIDGK